MATAPPMESPEGAEMEAPGAGEAASDTEICLRVGADGSLSVYLESEGGNEAPQPVPDIGAALKAILEMYRALPQPGASDQEQFTAGFGRESTRPGPGTPRGMY